MTCQTRSIHVSAGNGIIAAKRRGLGMDNYRRDLIICR